jgi:hypothetical protein
VGWTPAAEDLYHRLYTEMSDEDPGGLLGGIVARNQPHLLRLALTYALMDNRPHEIDVAHVTAAKAVWDYCRASAAYIFGDSTGDEIAERIRYALSQAYPDGLTRDEIYREVLQKNVPSARILLALTVLEKMKVIRITRSSSSGRGRPPETVYLDKDV